MSGPSDDRLEYYLTGDDGRWAISSSCKLCTVSTNLSRHQPSQTNRTGDSNGLTCDSGLNGPRTMKRDKPEITVLSPVWVPVTVIATLVNFSSSILLRSRLPTVYSGDATKNRSSGHRLFTSAQGGKTSDRIHSSNVMHVVSSSWRAVIRKISPV